MLAGGEAEEPKDEVTRHSRPGGCLFPKIMNTNWNRIGPIYVIRESREDFVWNQPSGTFVYFVKKSKNRSRSEEALGSDLTRQG
ncbi:hypothetical protein L596_007005 [Steinernema carpocapsae]|uniref:Uncharacterized protein n=1 Tax=Steinernema carpocapsae TaxID=34508 RepID=A0A4U5P7V0_STECR|nr:hypothetical protein L596_007005 [Steinernema carpocapsae]